MTFLECHASVEVLIYGDAALLINFEQVIDEQVNRRVVALSQKLSNSRINGVEYVQAAYCSICIGFNRKLLSHEILSELVRESIAGFHLADSPQAGRHFNIPVCYAEEFALDMHEVLTMSGLSRDEVIEAHTAKSFHTFMLGFIPGFPYFGKLPDSLNCSRKSTPRIRVPARSVGLAGLQTGIYPLDSPGGWQIIGKTPVEILNRTDEPFLFQLGDQVSFFSITRSDFDRIERDVELDTFNYMSLRA